MEITKLADGGVSISRGDFLRYFEEAILPSFCATHWPSRRVTLTASAASRLFGIDCKDTHTDVIIGMMCGRRVLQVVAQLVIDLGLMEMRHHSLRDIYTHPDRFAPFDGNWRGFHVTCELDELRIDIDETSTPLDKARKAVAKLSDDEWRQLVEARETR